MINYLVSLLTGAVIAVMVTFNTEFGRLSSSTVSLIINQIVGIITLHIIMMAAKSNKTINPEQKKVKWYQESFGGFFGVGIISLNYISIVGAGATISMAGAVFGQSLMGLIFDLTGTMGMRRQKIGRKRILSLLISLCGIIIYFFGGDELNFYLFPSILAGILTMIQMVYNSNLAKAKGAFFSARQNVITGLFGALLYSFIFYRSETIDGFRALSEIPIYIMVAGGMLACIVVVSTNIVIPKIPAVISALLLSSGQILTALLIDYVLYDTFSLNLLLGTLIMIIGILTTLERKASR